MPEAEDYTKENLDKYITSRVLLPSGQLELMGTVNQRKRDANGNPVGVYDSNPIIDTHQYKVYLDDRTVK